MTKKIAIILFLAIAILAGVIFTLSGRGMMANNPVASLFESADSSATHAVVNFESPPEITRLGKQPSEKQNNATDKTLISAVLNNDRAGRWQRLKKGTVLEPQFIALLNDSDLESPRFAMYVHHLCLRAKMYEGSGSISKKDLREFIKWQDPKTSDASITSAFLLNGNFSARCGDLGNDRYGGMAIEPSLKALERGSVLLAAPTESKIDSDAQSTALNAVLRSPELAAVWLAARHLFFTKAADSGGYLNGLNSSEKNAVTWTVVCNFGGDCADDGLVRLDACLTSYLCEGNSVGEAVASAVGKDKVPVIAARANKLGLDLAAVGSDFFKPRPR